jgi:hypothetical protein
MSSEAPAITTAIPDLTAIPADRLAELGDSVLENAIKLYRERLAASGEPLSSFNARI